ncbi:Sec-independent protein translocase subunit TatB [Sulfurimonas sp. SAG-AH-194-I05]|nr:Sec-independent protein translocase protein TatB [Sulfurimonas sp. SAG-AH-194-I05]MDF1875223.1 Sec-independent protein translocase subunit TatB [Sulfurimonas sp. SAG-AH-194-I05]
MFGMGFTEILIIAVIAILFLGPDKLPSAMVDIAKFFRQMKKTVSNVKESMEEEMNVSEIKQEALAYKKQLLDVQGEVQKVTSIPDLASEFTDISDDIIEEIEKPKAPKEEKVTFKKKKKKKIEDDSIDV